MGPIVNEIEAEKLRRLLSALAHFRQLNETMPLQYVISFLIVATNEGQGVKDYSKMLGVNPTTMSRHLLDIGPRNRQMNDGYGLVQCRPNATDLRKHEYFITPKGKLLLDKILRYLGTSVDSLRGEAKG